MYVLFDSYSIKDPQEFDDKLGKLKVIPTIEHAELLAQKKVAHRN